MNPPSALYGAMNKERKPFTYTPGGLDLSEIKSERMAKRLMRNAMNQGVPETPVQTIQSPPVVAGTIPNFNCLPVQVFPSFQLPANPKSLLRTRSTEPKESSKNNITPVSTLFDSKHDNDSWKEINKPLSEYSNTDKRSNYIPANTFDYKPNSNPFLIEPTYGSYGNTKPLLPEKSYDATYYQLEPQGSIKEIKNKNNAPEEHSQSHKNSEDYSDVLLKNATNNEINPVHLISSPIQDVARNNYEQKEVKIVKKQTKTENESDQNGDTEAEVFVTLPPTQSSAAKSTKIEVSKKVLPDGTIEETKKTITKTTIDGKTEISTKTETRTIPKESAENVEEIEENEEEIEENVNEESNKALENKVSESIENEDAVPEDSAEEKDKESTKTEVKQNGHIITGEEKSEKSTTKKVVIIQSTEGESEEEVEEVEEEEVEEEEVEEIEEETGDVDVEEVVIIKKPPINEKEKENVQVDDEDNIETTNEEQDAGIKEEREIEQEDEVEEEEKEIKQEDEVEEEEKEKIQEDEVEDEEERDNEEPKVQQDDKEDNKEKEASDAEEQDVEIDEQNEKETVAEENSSLNEQSKEELEESKEEPNEVEEQEELPGKTTEINITVESKVEEETKTANDAIPTQADTTVLTDKHVINEETKTSSQSEPKVSFREPSIPLERVEDIEIKPIGPAQEIIKKSHTEIITTTTDKPSGALSTQTEYNRIENVVTVNRTTKTLDHAYEQIAQPAPTLKTYFSPINDRVLSTPQPISKPYQPVYTPEPQTERRHSLLLDRLSVDRQIPTQDIYQNSYSNQVYEQNQWSEEPQSEVLTVSNVKPSTITKNQQWYQQTQKENYVSNTVSPKPVLPSQIWNQQNQVQPQNQIPTQPQYQTYTQQPYTPKQEYQPTYVENNAQNLYKSNTNNLQQNTYSSYTPKPSWVSSTFDSRPVSNAPSNQYLHKNESTESYQKSTQQFNSSYVPPPWEQDSSYIPESQNYYQPPPTVNYTPTTNQAWKPKPAPSKFSKPTPTSYIPPAPNQSFVKPVSAEDTSKISGRKTYYSEYERRYISVPESTYIPNETKFPAQPDPSPQYYYDNNEPAEQVEPQWRKELREFTEKTSQISSQTERTSVRPPWEEDPKYTAPAEYTASATPTWTQTLRPRSWRERSYEPEYVGSKEWPKTNTLGRGRPQSSYVKSNVSTIPERTRGVSVDRYNPNNYQSPLAAEHPPVQSHTLNPTIHPKTYHNPSVPAYHARASAKPREHVTAYPQQRVRVDTRAPPVQSRSFKYLQWITGTED